jgi:predicted HAD superfamily Cof-like phosphohydrolase
MNVFDDQAIFMRACGQTVGEKNRNQFELYMELIREEFQELQTATSHDQVFDALLDIIVVCIGAGHSAGYPMADGWDAVAISNLRKINPTTGRVERREDGKILKPTGWRAPNLARLLQPLDQAKRSVHPAPESSTC